MTAQVIRFPTEKRQAAIQAERMPWHEAVAYQAGMVAGSWFVVCLIWWGLR